MRREILHRHRGLGKRVEHCFRDHASAATHVKDLDRGIAGKRHRRDQARDDRRPLALTPGIACKPPAYIVSRLPMMVMVIAMMMVVVIVAVMIMVVMMVRTVIMRLVGHHVLHLP